MAAPTVLEGTRLGGRYRVVGRLGLGGMGQVVEAVDERLGRHVAVKLVTTTDPTAAARLRAEATVLARLRHPAIVNVFDVGDHEGRPFVVTELVRGRSLGDRLATPGPVDPAWLARLGARMASALACAHDHGIVHRDLKPGNILLAEPDDQARLIDFGIAVSESAMALTSTGMVIGTPAYLSPEQVEGRRAGSPSDVYALGLVLVEALTGSRPFPGTPTESMAARLRTDAPLPETLPAGWTAVLGAMTRLVPAERPTAAEVATRLGALDPEAGPEATAAAAATTTMEAATSAFPPIPSVPPAPTSTSPAPIGPAPVPLVGVAAAEDRRRSRSRRTAVAAAVLAAGALVAVLGILGVMALGDGQGADPPTATTDVATDPTSASTSAPTTTPVTNPPTTSPTTVTTPPTTEPAPTPPGPVPAPNPDEGARGKGREGKGEGRGRGGDG